MNEATSLLLRLLLLFIVLFVSPLMTIRGCKEYRAGARTERWAEAKGIITASELSRPEEQGNAELRIHYDYMVNGVTRKGQRVCVGSMSALMVEKYVEEHPVGKEVTVYYDPADPAECVLETGAQESAYLALVMWPVFGIVFALLLWLLIKVESSRKHRGVHQGSVAESCE